MRERACPPLWTIAFLLVGLVPAGCGSDSTPMEPEADVPLEPCAVSHPLCTSRVEIGQRVYLQIYSTYRLDRGNPDATRAVIVVHGAGRNAGGAFTTMVTATRQRSDLEETVVIAPFFQTAEDMPDPDEVYWSSGGWKRGHLSRTEGPSPRVSSYAAMDVIIEKLADRSRFPELTEIVVAGHSAGGQVTHRYAAGSTVEDELNGIEMRYVVANPSTYLYLGPERWDGARFSLPDEGACPDYQVWHYGLTDLNSYMSRGPLGEIDERLVRRDVTILIGTADVGSAQLDMTCGAFLQGEHRYDRGQKLMDFMDALRPGHNHTESIVPGVAHSSNGMYTSTQGLNALFGG